jgi:hypothetical protein
MLVPKPSVHALGDYIVIDSRAGTRSQQEWVAF